MNQSMQQLRQAAASGEGQMRATLDLAREMGSTVQRQQDMRKARGAMRHAVERLPADALPEPASAVFAAPGLREQVIT